MTESRGSAVYEWDSSYEDDRAPWDLGRPQPALIGVADSGEITSPVLDSGCGSGEHALMLAERGHEVVGIDIAPRAIERAQEKAAQRGIGATFLVGDVLALDHLGRRFETVIDCGVFHVFDDPERVRYVRSVASILRPGGILFLLCFSEHTAGDQGPRRVTQAEIRTAFEDGWDVEEIWPARIEVLGHWFPEMPHGWLARILRTE
ncbi:MAG: class I SAM-dependent methyltransferase [Acidimicrobiia bacterium]